MLRNQVNFHSSIKGQKSFSACFVADKNNGNFDENSFVLISSANYILPNLTLEKSYEHRSHAFEENGYWHYCIDAYKNPSDGDYQYFTLYNYSDFT